MPAQFLGDGSNLANCRMPLGVVEDHPDGALSEIVGA